MAPQSDIDTETDSDFIARIARLVTRAGGQNALARATGLSLGAIQRYLKGGEPTRGALIRLATAGNVSLDWLVYGGMDEQSSPAHNPVPVYGFAECGLQGWYNPVRYKINATLDWPDPELYAVVASGLSMVPEGIHPGHICIISPNTRAHTGDAVLIRRNDGASTIKRLVREDDTWVHVQGWLDPEKENAPQIPYTDQIKRSVIEQLAPVIFIKRRA
ncbi:LexA family protein [Micavibrio aeruginosavorus]|uniref:Helix-turn-helix family protein n=1 Tax=Micavibrio aeruginosavorus (strain ARL-13) TaxID=856793 RepID=G2KPZ2_MICAA|nr:S24 family peptidase [Micavibrio aeruginosavorus]AEP10360.1 helix-turn-helix family protein [Micavibrio aeruginosavorus ARL-13]